MMRAFIRSLIALAYLASATLAQASFVINSYQFAVAGADPSITFLQCSSEDATNATTYTFSGQNTGTASADRHTLVAVSAVDGTSNYTLNTLTVGGDSATRSVEYDNSAAGVGHASVWIIANSAGTSESVILTFSEQINNARVCLWQVNNIASATAVATITDREATSGATLTLDINVSAKGVAAAICSVAPGTITWTWTGLTGLYDNEAAERSTTVADFTNDAVANSPLAITATPTSNGGTCASASYL